MPGPPSCTVTSGDLLPQGSLAAAFRLSCLSHNGCIAAKFHVLRDGTHLWRVQERFDTTGPLAFSKASDLRHGGPHARPSPTSCAGFSPALI